MKIEQVLVLHLYNNKQITLQGIGTFRLDPSFSLPSDTEKEIVLPAGAITFDYDPKATEDASLVASIVQNTTKIKPLASADLDSFLGQGSYFLNLGKPFVLEGIGTLEKTQHGILDFKAGQFISQKLEAPKSLKENENEESSGLFNVYNREPDNNRRKIAIIVFTIIILSLIAWAAYYFGFKNKTAGDEKSLLNTEQKTIMPDTFSVKNDTIKESEFINNNPPRDSVVDDYSFKIVFDVIKSKQAALNSMNRLNSWGRHVIMYTNDSINYKLAELFKTPLSDTSRAKEYFNKFYKGKVSVEIK